MAEKSPYISVAEAFRLDYEVNDIEAVLEDLAQDRIDSHQVLLSLERKNNILRGTVFPDKFPKQYMPHPENEGFLIPYLNFDPTRHILFQASCFERNCEPGNEEHRFYIHPLWAKEINVKPDGHFFCVPTSSTRTVVVNTEDVLQCVKTHLPIHIGPFRRNLTLSAIQHGINITDDFLSGYMPENFGILPEDIGFGDIEKGFGCVYRRIQDGFLLPMFSIYSPTPAGSDLWGTLLVQILSKNNLPGEELTETFIRTIVSPYMKNWFWAIREKGIILEPHGQNTLIELDQNGRIVRFLYRDFQGLRVIAPIRHAKQLKQLERHVLTNEEEIMKSLSLVYDLYISDYLFRNLVKALSQQCEVDIDLLRREIAEQFHFHARGLLKLFHTQKLRTAIVDGFQQRFEGEAIIQECGIPEFR